MSNKRNSTKLLESVGGIRQVISRFGSISNSFTGGPLNSQQVNLTTAVLENIDSTVRESINGPRYEIIKGIFEKHFLYYLSLLIFCKLGKNKDYNCI